MPRLFHVSEQGPLTVFAPRPAPPGSPYEGQPLVWAVDEAHLPNYLLPRDCPRVCWVPGPSAPTLLRSDASRAIVIEREWQPRLRDVALYVHELEPDGFAEIDASAGYWVSEAAVRVSGSVIVDDCESALAERAVELRVTDDIWPFVDAVQNRGGQFSVIRARNARPRRRATWAAVRGESRRLIGAGRRRCPRGRASATRR